MFKNKITRGEYAKINKIHSARETRPLRKNHTETKILQQAVGEIQRLLPNCENFLFSGSFKIETCVIGSRRADIDNIGKGILDALQGSAYGNDRDCDDFRSYRGNIK